jgi:transposase
VCATFERDRSQLTLLPDCLEGWISEENAVHVIDAFVKALDLNGMGSSA